MDSPPSRSLPTETPNVGGNEFDDLDDLFDYDAGGINDPFSENYVVPGSKNKETAKDSASNAKTGAGLGIDEEIEVAKKPRVPRVKLDEHKLLSSAGIPKLRKKAADHLKFKGKGHEVYVYSDAARLLAFYQLWLDDLFPKAKFLDALAMVEKLGHKKMIQSARMDWINEGKPKSSVHEDSLFDEPELPPRDGDGREKTVSRIAPIFENIASERPKTPVPNRDPDFDDMYDATPKVARQNPAAQSTSVFGAGNNSLFGPPKVFTAGDDGPPDDDLDALLAEAEQEGNNDEVLDDDLEAFLAAENDMNASNQPAKQNMEKSVQAETDDMDAMEAMADMDMDMDMNGGW
ncbi:chromosome segregation in meiosis- protein [Ciborinia camelliae]|nr:chromosome segregation in meiosis- protein [Ciborinia camelliae]